MLQSTSSEVEFLHKLFRIILTFLYVFFSVYCSQFFPTNCFATDFQNANAGLELFYDGCFYVPVRLC